VASHANNLAEVLRGTHDRGSVPGISVALVDRDGVVETAASGVRRLPDPDEVTPDTAYLWFSMTKIVTATVALQLAQEGVLDLDEPIDVHLGDMTSPDIGKRITPAHLLSHTSGLPNPMPLKWVHRAGAPSPDLREFVFRLGRKRIRSKVEPGTTAQYTNVGYLMLGLVLEVASGIRFDLLVKQRVLDPLGMERTGFLYPFDEDRAIGHHRGGRAFGAALRAIVPSSIGLTRVDGFVRLDPFYVDGAPYGGLVGSVTDAAKFLHSHLAGSLLSEDVRRTMQTISHEGKRLATGVGWFRTPHTRDAYPDAVEHLGGGAGFYNVMRLDRRSNTGVVVMGNSTRYDIDAVADQALAYLARR
jgi:CubicO group peptidase (beta-lactamase class C family)